MKLSTLTTKESKLSFFVRDQTGYAMTISIQDGTSFVE